MSERTWPPRGLNAEEAAYYIGVSVNKLISEVRAGKMPDRVTVAPGCRRWLRDDLDKYLDQQRSGGPVSAIDENEWIAADGTCGDPIRQRVRGQGQAVPVLPAPRLPRAPARRTGNA